MARQNVRILIIDDDADVLHSASLLLQQYYSQVDTEQDPKSINRIVSQCDYDLILLDMNFRRGEHDGREGLYWLERILTIKPRMPVILITAYGEVALAVEAMRQGGANFVLKPWKNQKLLEAVTYALSHRSSSASSAASLSEETATMIGQSPAMRAVYELIDKVAATTASVLILGENGTGKELVAQALHRRSLRAQQPFVRVDLGAVTPSLLESELFGHVRGAFTDAHQDQMGKFELAQGGTLFLDEIGNLALTQQAKLLTALQSRCIRRVGSNEEIPLDIRLICATNQPLTEMVQSSEPGFREDLLYRINTVEMPVPPLRERTEDIRSLAEHFLGLYARKYHKPVPTLSTTTLRKLEQHDWPGNVRELQHAIERAVILSNQPTLPPEVFDLTPVSVVASSGIAHTLDENERNFIQRALHQHEGNVTQTARALGITRTALYRRLDKYGL